MTAAFLTPLRTEKIGPQRWLLTDDLLFRSVILPGVFVAPRGFQTDLASIPRIAWVLFPKVDIWDRPAVIHDAGYGNALMTEHGDRIFLIKHWGDKLFREALSVEGVSALKARFMYRFVSLFGDPKGHPLAAHREPIMPEVADA